MLCLCYGLFHLYLSDTEAKYVFVSSLGTSTGCFGIIGVMRSYSAYSMGHLFIYFLNAEVYFFYNGVNDTGRAEKMFRWGKSCVSLSYLLFMGSFKPPRLEENMVTVQLFGSLPHLWCLPQPPASKKMPSQSCIMIFFSPPPPPPPHILGKAEIRECANGGKRNLSVALCEDSGSGLGGGGLCQAEKRDVRV